MPEGKPPADDSENVVDLAAFRTSRGRKGDTQSSELRAALQRLAPTPQDEAALDAVHQYAGDSDEATPLSERDQALIEYMKSVDSSQWTEEEFKEFMASRDATMNETEDQ